MAVDNLSSSPSFRELDDVFLQSQARIWVGEVLYTRFDEQLSISDLLSDGELLFEVSKALWNMLLVKFTNFKSCMFVSVDTRKSSGRYRPYSNADSFLKVCKVLGLSGVDLFSPSDVVEKKDTRKVCICIRSLSKKARSKHLNVPDFDIVTKTVAMPTEVVGCIRRSLELSTSTVSHGQNKHSTLKYFSSSALHKQEDESFVEESDETKSNFSECSYADFLYFESPETVNKYALSQHSDTKNQQVDKSAESVFLEYVDSDNEVESRLIITPVTRSMCRISPTSTCSLDFDFDLRTLSPDLQQSGVFNLCNQSVLDLSDEACWDDAKSVDEDFESLNQISSNQETVGVKMSDLKRSYELVRCDDVLGYEKKQDDGVECMVEPNTNGKNNKRIVENTLKTVAKGTALIGILFFLHIRNRSKKGSEIHWKSSGVVFSREKGNKIYPADKFKFGN